MEKTDFDLAFDNYKDLTKYAEEFSEGSESLKNVLLNMWNKRIRTNSCCKGHDYETYYSVPYLSFEIDNNSRNLMNQLLSVEMMNGVDYSFYSRPDYSRIDHSICMRNNTFEKEMELINNLLVDDKEVSNSFADDIYYLLNHSLSNNLVANICVRFDRSIELLIERLDDIIYEVIFDKDLMDVINDDFIGIPLKCNEESIHLLVEKLKNNN